MRLRVGTRGSQLALAQAEIVASKLRALHPGLETETVVIQTSGDILYDQNLAEIGGKGLFLKELQVALQESTIDIAVHSLKDMLVENAEGLVIGCVLEREDPADALVSYKFPHLNAMPSESIIGTSSNRRAVAIRALQPQLKVVPLRGNINTRLAKLDRGLVDGCVLALAGLKRLNLQHHVTQIFTPQEMIPAVGQGVIGVEVREKNAAIRGLLAPLNHIDTFICITAERAFQEALGGNCTLPIAAYAHIDGTQLHLTTMFFSPQHQKTFFAETRISANDDVRQAGLKCAELIKEAMTAQ
jgi:hydroxymethylbilane synthase